MQQYPHHIAADEDHTPVPDNVEDPANCQTCGLAITWDAKHHGFTDK